MSAVDYIVRTYQTDALVGLIRSYADGRTDDEAFKAALGVDMTAFGDAWLADVKAKQPTQYGPQPAPSGPVPAAWAGSVGGVSPSVAPGGAAQAPAPSTAATTARRCRHGRRARRTGLDGAAGGGHRGRRRRRARPGARAGTGRRTSGRDLGRRSACARSRAGRSRSAWRCSRSASSSPPSSPPRVRGSATRPRSERRSSRPPPACRPSRTGSRPGSSRSAAQIQAIESEGEGAADLVKQLNAQLEQARIAAGLIALTGTGIVLQLEDSKEPVPPGGSESDYLVGSRDIRTVVEQLWGAGAEAIAVNGERITPTTAIIDIGTSLLVNSAYLAPPYQVSALGPADLYDRLSASPGFVDFVRARSDGYGIRVSIAEPESVDIPAFVGTVTLRYSRPLASPSAGPSATPSSVPGG